jgi:predicted GNAT superfamily acetyltransferase
MLPRIRDLHGVLSPRDELLRLNNGARETSLLTREKLDRMISAARVATFIEPCAAFLLAFEQADAYEGGHFMWFRRRLDRFLYIDRVVVAQDRRRHGLGRLLYADVFQLAQQLGHTSVVCEVNVLPPNPTSDKFHAALGFEELGRAAMDGGAKVVRYLLRRDDAAGVSAHAAEG